VAPRLIVLGWDSATFDLVDPLVEAGRLPNLARLIERGTRGPLASTWPPMTDCAWTSAFTGRNPGAHGIFGSWYRAPGEYGCRYFSSRDRRAAAVWEMTSDVRWLVWNVPMTFPPTAIDGVMVAGYGAPPGARFCEPASFQDELAARWPLEDLLDRAPHASLERFLADLIRGLEAQAEALPFAARESGADCVVAVWPHVDRAQHFFWRFRDTDHPLADAVARVYEAMDAATGAVIDAFPTSDVIVLSDHGAGPLHGDINVGAHLVASGHAAYSAPKRNVLADIAWAMPPFIRRAARRVAPGAARRAMGAALVKQLGPFDWTRTKALVGVNGDLWLNLEGREPRGTVSESDAPGLLDELVAGLTKIEDPARGAPVFAAIHRRAEIYSGPALSLAPDLMLDSWSAGYRVAVKRDPSPVVVGPPTSLAGVREPWSSEHRPTGIFVASGDRIASAEVGEASLYDTAPTMLALLEQPVAADSDGRVLVEAIDEGFLLDHPVAEREVAPRNAVSGYSDEEAAAVAAHLQDLGYIE